MTHKEIRTEDKARSTMIVACRKFLAKLGGHRTSNLLFPYLIEVAAKDFGLKFVGCDPTDLNFLPIPQEELTVIHNITRKRESHPSMRRRRKYEEMIPMVEEALSDERETVRL